MIRYVRVISRDEVDPQGQTILAKAKKLGIAGGITHIKTARVFWLEGCTHDEASALAENVLADHHVEQFAIDRPAYPDQRGAAVVHVAYRPGVMNPEAASILIAAQTLGVTLVAASSSTEYVFYGNKPEAAARRITERLLCNPVVQYVVKRLPRTLRIKGKKGTVKIVLIRELFEDELAQLSEGMHLYLSLDAMVRIQRMFEHMEREPTSAELYSLAAAWSNHCFHGEWKRPVELDGKLKPSFLERIRSTAIRHPHGVVSAFDDNAGAVDFYDGMAIVAKVESHIGPSSIEPEGGAATGTGGVIRDDLAEGIGGARVTALTDIFCFAPPTLRDAEVPPGCLHPAYLMEGTRRGIEKYGNRIGMPTANGSYHFDAGFRAKPTVLCGAIGLMDAKRAKKRDLVVGDLLLLVGGRTGLDGIHGATFSSTEMHAGTAKVHSSAVQIGHPIEERRVYEALLALAEEDRIRSLTDLGAAGLNSAVSEITKDIGSHTYLERVILKYMGLEPEEILLSESQERMLVVVSPEHVDDAITTCARFNSEATVIGECTGDRRFQVTYEGVSVVDLHMDFVHIGPPTVPHVLSSHRHPLQYLPAPPIPKNWIYAIRDVLAHPNVCSKRCVTTRFDLEVQGTAVVVPYGDGALDGPNDALVQAPILGKPYGLIVAHGLHPALNRIDPYRGAQWAVAEAVANLTAVGGDVREMHFLDNFVTGSLDAGNAWATDRMVDALVESAAGFRTCFISGKDSGSSRYIYPDGRILDVPPVICIHVVGKIPDVRHTVTSPFKQSGSYIVLIGTIDCEGMGGSAYYDTIGATSAKVPEVDAAWVAMETSIRIRELIVAGKIRACHDISDGGLVATVIEMCFGGGIGADLRWHGRHLRNERAYRADHFLLSESAGCYVVEVDPEQMPMLAGLPYEVIGETVSHPSITLSGPGLPGCFIPLDVLHAAYERPMMEVFG